MKQSKLFYKTNKEVVGDAETVSHKLLLRGGFIEQVAAGIYNFLPLGYRVIQRITEIIREEINRIGGQEVFLAALQPKKFWQQSGRWDKMDPPLFKLKDRHGKMLALGSTHEELFTRMVRTRVSSYKDLPLALYQIQTKFRNEIRSTGGLLRVREFLMKDLYSFHTALQDLDRYYQEVLGAYHKIFSRCGLETVVSEAGSGTIGGDECHEFQLPCPRGEDKILLCRKCGYAVNREVGKSPKTCPQCKSKMNALSAIELGHIFKLGTVYSEKMGAYFTDRKGGQKPIYMGCYGIGLGRLLAAIIEDRHYHDAQGIIWPSAVAPFDIHLLRIDGGEMMVARLAEKVYNTLTSRGFAVLDDDRQEVSPGEKLVESDLIGIPVRLVVSEKTKPKIEYKKRGSKKVELLDLDQLVSILKDRG